MLQEAINAVASLARLQSEAQARLKDAKFMDDPHDDSHYYLLHDGVLTEKEVPPPKREHVVNELDSLIRLAVRAKEESKSPVLWHCETGVILVWDDDDRREQAAWPLTRSQLWQSIGEVNGRALKQPLMIRLLRFALADAISAPELLDAIRTVKFTRKSDASGEINHGRESMGRSVDLEVTGAATLPENVLLHNVSIYDELSYPLDLRFGLEVNVSEETFELCALAGVLTAARRETQIELGRVLTEAIKAAGIEVPVFFGTP